MQRLRKISEIIQEISVAERKDLLVADIGTNHAYLPIHLVKNGICSHVIATDVNLYPFRLAKNNVSKAGLTDHIDVRHLYGFDGLENENIDVYVMAGMGGERIVKILSKAPLLDISAYLILQPQKNLDILKSWLEANGFAIDKEYKVKQKWRYYDIIKAIKLKTNSCLKNQ